MTPKATTCQVRPLFVTAAWIRALDQIPRGQQMKAIRCLLDYCTTGQVTWQRLKNQDARLMARLGIENMVEKARGVHRG